MIWINFPKMSLSFHRAILIFSGTIDIQTNYRIIFLFFVLVALAIISAAGTVVWTNNNIPDAWYLEFLRELNILNIFKRGKSNLREV